MLCEIHNFGNFFMTWVSLTAIGFVAIMTMSGIIFWRFYQNPTYELWTRKSNPRFPAAEMVRNEIVQTMKGMCSATLCPSVSLYLAAHGQSKAYCGTGPNGEYGFLYHLVSFLIVWLAVDFWEFYYHRMGHTTVTGWKQHHWHHLFYNPSPFAVIADEYIDQFVRSLPLVLFPLIAPINIDMMFAMFAIFFYAYGVYLHWGFELDWPDAHHPWINTAFQHYLHHAISVKNKPYHTGFFFKLWDQLFGSMYTGECFCVKCARSRGERTRAQYDEIIKAKPDYSVLLKPSFWKGALSTSTKQVAAPGGSDVVAPKSQ